MEAVAKIGAAAIGAVLNTALPRLYSAIEKAKKLCDLDAGVQEIQSELEYVQAVIRDCRTSRYGMSDFQRIWIKDLSRLAYDIEDCVDRFLLPHGAKKMTPEQLSDKIVELKTSADRIRNRFQCYSSEDGASSSTSGAPTSHDQGIPGQAGNEVVGMDKPLRDLMTLLQKSESPTEGKLKVISIVGFGGIGKKTLLARQLYENLHHEYPLHAFVNAKGKDKEEILKEILEKLPEQACTSIQAPQVDEASTSLGLLLLNQVHVLWTKMTNFFCISLFFLLSFLGWIRAELPEDPPLTTNDPEVNNGAHGASPPRGDNGIHGSSASNEVSQHRNDVETQLKSRLGTNRYFIVIDGAHSEQLGCDIISDFHQEEGVDSRIIVTTTIQSKACSCRDGGDVYKMRPLEDVQSEAQFFKIVLDNNYESLCSGLQDRLLYLCMFPRDHPVRRGPLIRRWLAEGPGMGCRYPRVNVETLINRNFETLIDRNLIWPIQVSNNEKVKTCRLPGMTLDYITDISKSENFMMLSCGDGTCEPQDIRRLSLHHTRPSDNMRVLQQQHLSRLRTLAVFNEGQEGPLDFAKCKLLRVLDLEACNCVNESHLLQICDLLYLLKYLSLRLPKSITKVPSEITSLKGLETLDLGKETVVKVPVQVIKLPRLKHLLGKFKLATTYSYSKNKKLKEFLEKKSMLETLAGFVTSKGQGFPPLMRHMWQLTKVKIWCDSEANDGIWTPLSEAIEDFLRRSCEMLEVPRSLSIDFQKESEAFPNFRRAHDCPGNLFSLKLRGHGRLTQIPEFVTSVGSITELCLSSTTLVFGDDVLGGLSHLSLLRYLKLEATSSIEGPVVIGPEMLKSLERMCLVAEQNLPWITIQDGALKYLVSLHLICRGLDGLSGVNITDLKKLKEVALHSGAAKETKENWEDAAEGHPNRPRVLFIEGP